MRFRLKLEGGNAVYPTDFDTRHRSFLESDSILGLKFSTGHRIGLDSEGAGQTLCEPTMLLGGMQLKLNYDRSIQFS